MQSRGYGFGSKIGARHGSNSPLWDEQNPPNPDDRISRKIADDSILHKGKPYNQGPLHVIAGGFDWEPPHYKYWNPLRNYREKPLD